MPSSSKPKESSKTSSSNSKSSNNSSKTITTKNKPTSNNTSYNASNKVYSMDSNSRSKPMAPRAGFTQTRRRYGNGGKTRY